MGPAAETRSLVPAETVQGAAIYNTDGDNLGSIDDIVIDRNTGNVAYAIMSFGGFLGHRNRYFPLAWSSLKYDTSLRGYVVHLQRAQLEAAPACGRWL
jgi:hypothetical protein